MTSDRDHRRNEGGAWDGTDNEERFTDGTGRVLEILTRSQQGSSLVISSEKTGKLRWKDAGTGCDLPGERRSVLD